MELRNKKILLKRMKYPSESAGGVFIPKAHRGEPSEGRVVDAGPKCEEITAGDRVLFVHYAGMEIEHNDELHILMDEEDILCKVVEPQHS